MKNNCSEEEEEEKNTESRVRVGGKGEAVREYKDGKKEGRKEKDK